MFIKAIAAFYALVISDIVYGVDDYVVCHIEGCGERKKTTKCRIQYTSSGKAYFVKNRERYYLTDFMKI